MQQSPNLGSQVKAKINARSHHTEIRKLIYSGQKTEDHSNNNTIHTEAKNSRRDVILQKLEEADRHLN